ncbi:MAG: tRNA (cytidine(34)-2'-O)-methyltransferase [Lachnospiraceae bacterium]|nr:tRNA (cytidine(34)-2'-O)-methyltransferase [Lachnospiraceae bacterium]NBJ81914.1 tRNA (cytidine(34)-2'-O)-methyltransferase [bacterium 1XD42-76]NBK04414.1 tRNA (cytidine(34)-2'-O)-methyltransferase [bacterium 1XD42-94]
MNIVLYEPEMPANTGNIGRTCVATNTRLHLIEPLGFRLGEKQRVRAGLDYWDKLDVTVYSDYGEFLERNPGARLYFATTKATRAYTEVQYEPDCFLVFGPESRGLPEELLAENQSSCVRIPMWGDIRSLNLSNAAAVVLYEALRQNGFERMTMTGRLHRLEWQ